MLSCWGMPFEDAMPKGADARIITNKKRLNVLPSCRDPHRASFQIVSVLLDIWLSVKTASCNLIFFLANHITLLKAFCRN